MNKNIILFIPFVGIGYVIHFAITKGLSTPMCGALVGIFSAIIQAISLTLLLNLLFYNLI